MEEKILNPRMSLKDLREYSPEMASLVPHLVVFGDFPVNEDITLDANGPLQGRLLSEALTYLEKKIREGARICSSFYTEEELEATRSKRKTSLIFIPGKKGARTIFITSGGAFMGVYNLFEGISCGYELSRKGYNVFVVTYRVSRYPVVDNAMEDIAAAYKYIEENSKDFDVDLKDYAFMGMSAGGHLAGIWATKGKGSLKYGIPRPSCLLLAYPALSTIDFLEDMENNRYTPGHCKVLRLYLNLIGGRNSGREKLSEYSVELNIDEDYPPVYLIQCRDDDKVNFSTALRMQKALEENKIFNEVVFLDKGGHGFGAGLDMEAKGWLCEAESFYQKVCSGSGIL